MSTKRLALAILLLLIFAAAGVYMARSEGRGQQALAPGSRHESIQMETSASTEIEQASKAATDGSEAGRIAANPTVEVRKQNNAPESGSFVHGRVVVRDRDGIERADLSGELYLDTYGGGNRGSRRIPFENGAWKIPFLEKPHARRARPREAWVNGEKAYPENFRKQQDWSPGQELAFHFYLPPRGQLHVLDAETGVELSQISIVQPDPHAHYGNQHPGIEFSSRIVEQGLISPIRLSPKENARDPHREGQLFIGVAGYAWSRIDYDFKKGEDRIVELQPGASLALSVQGIRSGDRVFVRVHQGVSGQDLFEVELNEDRDFILDGLTPGSLFVAAELGERFDRKIQLAKASSELHVGEQTSLVLQLELSPSAEFVASEGLFLIAEEWEMPQQAHGVLRLLDAPLSGADAQHGLTGERVESPREGYDAYRWTEKKLQVGAYQLVVFKASDGLPDEMASMHIDLPPGGKKDFEFVIPPPCECLVRVLDNVTGRLAPLRFVAWSPARPDGIMRGRLAIAVLDSERQAFVIKAPEGQVQIRVDEWPYVGLQETLRCDQSLEPHILRLIEASRLTIRFFDGEKPLAFPPGWNPGLMEQHGPGFTMCAQESPYEQRYMFSKPGPYNLSLPIIEGYATQAPVQFEVLDGELTEIVVNYERL